MVEGTVVVVVVVVTIGDEEDGPSCGEELVMQQLPPSGQFAFSSISSQKRANKPLTHSPLHGFFD